MPSKQPFEVIPDHRNLEYLCDAKSLNPQQAHWALFFTSFNFTITYRPRQKNQKADALSRIHNPEPNSSPHKPILPSAIIVSPIHGPSMTRSLKPHSQSQPRGPGEDLCTNCSPPIPHGQQTLSLINSHYCWPNMAQNISRYVRGCSVCAISKVPRKIPEGKLVPLPIPQ